MSNSPEAKPFAVLVAPDILDLLEYLDEELRAELVDVSGVITNFIVPLLLLRGTLL